MTRPDCQSKLQNEPPFAEAWTKGMEAKDADLVEATLRQGRVDSTGKFRLVYRRSYLALTLNDFKGK